MDSKQPDQIDKELYAVDPKTDCPHEKELDLKELSEAITREKINMPCKDCQDTKENWMCLYCKEVFCSRYVNSHMSAHHQQTGHKVALSFSDGSFWCYSCDSYVYSGGYRSLAIKFGNEKFADEDKTNKFADQLSNLSIKLKTEDKQEKIFNKDEFVNGLRNKKFKNIVFLTGAGISVSAGIPDFRTPGTGLYSKVQKLGLPFPEAVFTLEYLKEKPEAFYTVAKELLSYKASPTIAHYFIKMMADDGTLLVNYTQNIDGLETQAGIDPKYLVEAHGHLRSAHCVECHKEMPINEFLSHVNEGKVYRCECEGIIKPDVIFFGERLPDSFFNSFYQIEESDLVIIMGTSLKVFPFANLVSLIRKTTPIVLINRENPGINRDNFLFLDGDIDSRVLEIIKAVGWEERLNELKQKKDL